jgi:hypothetical protein
VALAVSVTGLGRKARRMIQDASVPLQDLLPHRADSLRQRSRTRCPTEETTMTTATPQATITESTTVRQTITLPWPRRALALAGAAIVSLMLLGSVVLGMTAMALPDTIAVAPLVRTAV